MLSTHYRQPFNWTAAGVKNAFATLDTWYKLTADVHEPSDAFISSTILEALEDDLNTPRAITEMHHLRQRAASGDFEARHMLKASARLMGLLTRDTEDWLAWQPAALNIDAAEIEALIVARAAARAAKDFAEADRLREEIEAKGVRISDGPEGTSWEVAR
jgi:cysteinyl-tRNA synthetase